MTGVLKKEGGNLETELHTGQPRMPPEDEGRDQDTTPGSRGVPEMASKPPEARERQETASVDTLTLAFQPLE